MEAQVVCVVTNIWTYLKIDCYRLNYGTLEHIIISPVFSLIFQGYPAKNRRGNVELKGAVFECVTVNFEIQTPTVVTAQMGQLYMYLV